MFSLKPNKLFKKVLYLSVFAKMLLFNAVLADSSSVIQQYRLPSAKTIEKIKSNEDFIYREEARGRSLWQMFTDWLKSLFDVKEGSFMDDFLSKYIWYILIVAVFGFIIYKLFRSEITGLFYRNMNRVNINVSELEENIHEIDFDKQINESVTNKNYRYALRLYYLKSLKTLSDNGLIHWEKDKTNKDFISELSGSDFHPLFEQITTQFNRIWYGDFPVDEVAFEEAKNQFNNFNSRLKGGLK
jgi:hypothetical protein